MERCFDKYAMKLWVSFNCKSRYELLCAEEGETRETDTHSGEQGHKTVPCYTEVPQLLAASPWITAADKQSGSASLG